MTVNQINDSLIAAMETLASKLDKDVTNTMTIECTITATVDAEEGEYTVEYLGNKFTAKAIDRTIHYSKKDNVFVIVPNGDFSGTKMIIGYPTNRASKSVSIEKEVVTGRDILFFPKTEIDLCSYIPEEKEITFTSDFYKETFPKYQEDGYKKFRLSYKLKVDGPMENQTINNSYGVRLTIPIIDAGGNPDEIVTVLGMQGDKGTSTLIGDPYNLPVWVKQNVDITIPAGAQVQPEGIKAAAFVYGFNETSDEEIINQHLSFRELEKELLQKNLLEYDNNKILSVDFLKSNQVFDEQLTLLIDSLFEITELYKKEEVSKESFEDRYKNLINNILFINSQKQEAYIVLSNKKMIFSLLDKIQNMYKTFSNILEIVYSIKDSNLELKDLKSYINEKFDEYYQQVDEYKKWFEDYLEEWLTIRNMNVIKSVFQMMNIDKNFFNIHIKQIELHAIKQFTSKELNGYNLFLNSTNGFYFKDIICKKTLIKPEFRNNGVSILLQTLPIYWFIQDPSIKEIDVDGNPMDGYSSIGGEGWRLIKSESTELEIDINNIIDKRLYKCLIIYDSQIINKMFYIERLGQKTVSITSMENTNKIVRDIGVAELTCHIEGDNYSYLWGMYDKEGVLLDTFTGKNISVHSSKLDDITQFQCVVYSEEVAVAWAFYSVSLVEDLGYHVEIENGGVAIKYDAYGHAPKSKNYSGGDKYVLQPLTYTIYRSDGIKFNASEYSQVTATWRVPTTETCMLNFQIPSNAEFEKEKDPATGRDVIVPIKEVIQDDEGNEEIRTFYEFSYTGLEEVVRYNFAQHREENSEGQKVTVYDTYDSKRKNNTVYLTVKFGDITLYDNTKFRISKEGTKETRYATKEIVTGIKYNPIKTKIPIIVNEVPTEIEVITDIQITPITEEIIILDD